MFAYRIVPGQNIQSLTREEFARRKPHGHEVCLRVRAVSLNYRDLMVARGSYSLASGQPVIPCSDAAGEVIAIGPDVTRFRVGDRVVTSFFPSWIDGEVTSEKSVGALGGSADGVLAEEVVLHENALAHFPEHLNFAQASTLSCAGVTAWNMLFEAAALKPGETVLLLGTGGVSIWALQLAKAAGLRTIITSSSDEKLQRARALGADDVVNYRTTPEWHEEVLRLTRGRGVGLVAELGGRDTLARSIAATSATGTIALVGGVSGFTSELDIISVIGGAKRLAGIYVGSRAMLEDLARFVGAAQLVPVVDRVFGFAEAQQAYLHLDSGKHFGKVVIEVTTQGA